MSEAEFALEPEAESLCAEPRFLAGSEVRELRNLVEGLLGLSGVEVVTGLDRSFLEELLGRVELATDDDVQWVTELAQGRERERCLRGEGVSRA